VKIVGDLYAFNFVKNVIYNKMQVGDEDNTQARFKYVRGDPLVIGRRLERPKVVMKQRHLIRFPVNRETYRSCRGDVNLPAKLC